MVSKHMTQNSWKEQIQISISMIYHFAFYNQLNFSKKIKLIRI